MGEENMSGSQMTLAGERGKCQHCMLSKSFKAVKAIFSFIDGWVPIHPWGSFSWSIPTLWWIVNSPLLWLSMFAQKWWKHSSVLHGELFSSLKGAMAPETVLLRTTQISWSFMASTTRGDPWGWLDGHQANNSCTLFPAVVDGWWIWVWGSSNIYLI